MTGSRGVVTVSGGSVSVSTYNTFNVGVSGTGTLCISGGEVTAGSIHVGSNAGSSGVVTLSSGTLSVTSNYFYLGRYGEGSLHVDGGLLKSGTSNYFTWATAPVRPVPCSSAMARPGSGAFS